MAHLAIVNFLNKEYTMAMRRTRTTTRRPATRRARTIRKVSRPWAKQEMAFMRKFYSKYETAWVARQLGRTVYSIRYKAVDLGIRKASPTVWRGHKGTSNAFKASCKGNWQRKTTSRWNKPAKRTTRSKTWRASTARRKTRTAARRKTRR